MSDRSRPNKGLLTRLFGLHLAHRKRRHLLVIPKAQGSLTSSELRQKETNENRGDELHYLGICLLIRRTQVLKER